MTMNSTRREGGPKDKVTIGEETIVTREKSWIAAGYDI
jgi:hypothetical protein